MWTFSFEGMMSGTVHRSVLPEETLEWLKPSLTETRPWIVFFDGTLGGGGHSEAFLESDERIFLIGVDRDPDALARTKSRLAKYQSRMALSHANFSQMSQVLSDLPVPLREKLHESVFPKVDRILVDLGFSSDQLNDPARGFSFQGDAPLDMRMNRSEGKTAADILNESSEAELQSIFLRGGVKPPLHKILAKAICQDRPYATTAQFATLCSRVTSAKRTFRGDSGYKHPALVPFQALRIAVNNEFEEIESFLAQARDALAPGGRLLVISFHSLEDQIVANAMRTWSRTADDSCAVDLRREAPKTLGKILTKKAILPSATEIQENPRARSARLRVYERNVHGVSSATEPKKTHKKDKTGAVL